MSDPVMLAIAGALAGKTMELLAEGGRKAIGGLRELVKRRFASEPSAQAALEAAQQSPEDTEAQQDLAAALRLVAKRDSDFDQRLRQQWKDVEPLISAGPGSNVNSVSGTVHGNVNQYGSSGDITIHHHR